MSWVQLTLIDGNRPLWIYQAQSIAMRRALSQDATLVTVAGVDFAVAEPVSTIKQLIHGSFPFPANQSKQK